MDPKCRPGRAARLENCIYKIGRVKRLKTVIGRAAPGPEFWKYDGQGRAGRTSFKLGWAGPDSGPSSLKKKIGVSGPRPVV